MSPSNEDNDNSPLTEKESLKIHRLVTDDGDGGDFPWKPWLWMDPRLDPFVILLCVSLFVLLLHKERDWGKRSLRSGTWLLSPKESLKRTRRTTCQVPKSERSQIKFYIYSFLECVVIRVCMSLCTCVCVCFTWWDSPKKITKGKSWESTLVILSISLYSHKVELFLVWWEGIRSVTSKILIHER